MKRMIRAALSAVVVVAAVVAWNIYSNRTFVETFYTTESYKIEESVRIIFLADLHQASFGKDNETLISRVGVLKPDAIILAGDMVNKDAPDWDCAVRLCEALVEIAPVYYGLGNHENEALYGDDLSREFLEAQSGALGSPPEDFTPLLQDARTWERLERTGAQLLQNESVAVELEGNRVEIGGVATNVSSFWPYSRQFITRFMEESPETYKILICHRPEVVTEYLSDAPVDLALSGHNHGGIIRIPGVGGLMSDAEGLFPAYDGGWYENGSMTHLISRGLGGHGAVPRIFNKPEIIVLDIN